MNRAIYCLLSIILIRSNTILMCMDQQQKAVPNPLSKREDISHPTPISNTKAVERLNAILLARAASIGSLPSPTSCTNTAPGTTTSSNENSNN
jgi:hypothetical protein